MRDSITASVRILDERLPDATKRLWTLVKRARKAGSDMDLSVEDPRIRTVPLVGMSGTSRDVDVGESSVVLTGGNARRDGWRIAARVTRGDDPVVTHLDGEAVSSDPHCPDGYCDHCQKKRAKKVLFLARHEDGDEMFVGKSCLRDFMGVEDPGAISATFTVVEEMREMSRWDFGGAGEWDHLEDLVARCVAAMADEGWVSVASAVDGRMSTRDLVMGSYSESPSFDEGAVADGSRVKEVVEVARAVVEEVRDFDPETEFEIVASRLFSEDTVTDLWRCAGTVAAATNASLKRLGISPDAEVTAPGVPSRHIGRPGDRVRSVRLRVTDRKIISGHYGDTILYTLLADERDTAKWFCTSGADHEVGFEFDADATVKRHGEFQGAKETVLTRITRVG